LSPLGRFAVHVVAPRLGREKLVAGPPKRFAQGIGATLSIAAMVSAFGFHNVTVAVVLVAMIAVAAFLEAAFAFCLGCAIFGQLMRWNVIPTDVCEACNDISSRLAARSATLVASS
jgi:hypothetical protein